MLEIQERACETCIYKKSSTLDIKVLENSVRDPRMQGHFKGFRVCHHSKTACCRGFWNRHKNHFDIGQLAQRLGMLKFVSHDVMTATARSIKRERKHNATSKNCA